LRPHLVAEAALLIKFTHAYTQTSSSSSRWTIFSAMMSSGILVFRHCPICICTYTMQHMKYVCTLQTFHLTCITQGCSVILLYTRDFGIQKLFDPICIKVAFFSVASKVYKGVIKQGEIIFKWYNIQCYLQVEGSSKGKFAIIALVGVLLECMSPMICCIL